MTFPKSPQGHFVKLFYKREQQPNNGYRKNNGSASQMFMSVYIVVDLPDGHVMSRNYVLSAEIRK